MSRAQRGRVALVGAHATAQGRFPERTAWDLGVEAFKGALASAGLARDDVQGLLTQLDRSGAMEPARFGQMVGLNPLVSGALDYGTAGFTIAYAAALIASGQCDVVACVYATNQGSAKFRFAESQDPFGAPYGFLSPTGSAALGFQHYLHRYGRLADRDKLGAIAVAWRKHAALNPIAWKREPLSREQYVDSRWIVWPLRRADVCLVNDGAACVILADTETARAISDRPVYLLGIGRQDALRMMENKDHLLVPHMRAAAERVRKVSGVAPADVDALYVQDAYASIVPSTLENYGYCGEGEALDFIQDGRIELGGELPLNTSGGQLSEGYLVGWLHHVELFRQLRGEAGARQVVGCEVAQFCATGGYREFTLSSVYANAL